MGSHGVPRAWVVLVNGRRNHGQWTGNQGAITRGRWRATPVGQSLWQVQEWSDEWCVWRDRGRPMFRNQLPAMFGTTGQTQATTKGRELGRAS